MSVYGLSTMVLVLESQRQGSIALSISSLVVDEERMRPRHGLG